MVINSGTDTEAMEEGLKRLRVFNKKYPMPAVEGADGVLKQALFGVFSSGWSAALKDPSLSIPELTDDILRYAMTATIGTSSSQEAEKFRLFWLFASEAYRTRAIKE